MKTSHATISATDAVWVIAFMSDMISWCANDRNGWKADVSRVPAN